MPQTTMYDNPDRPGPKDEQTKIVHANFMRSLRDFMDKQQRDKFKAFGKAYRGFFEIEDEGSVSNLSVPLIAAHVDSFYARLVGMRPIVDVQPREQNDVIRAAKQRLLIEYQWGVMRMLLHAAELAKTGLIYGIGWGKCTWRREVRRRLVLRSFQLPQEILGISLGPFQELLGNIQQTQLSERDDAVIWDDPWYENIPPDELYPDPDGTSIDSCRYLIHRTRMTWDELEALADGGQIEVNRAAMGRLKKRLESGSLLDDEASTTTLSEELADTFGGTGDSSLEEDPTKREFRLLEHWTDERVRWMVSGAPDVGLIRNEPHAIGMKPFVRFTPEPLPNELIGMSLTERLYSNNLHQNALTNAHMDNMFRTAYPQIMVPRGSVTNPAHIRFKAGGWFLADPVNPPQVFQYPEMKLSYYRTMEFLNQMADRIGGTPTFRGESPEGDVTATEASLLAQASGTKFGAMLQQMTEQPFKRLGRILVRLNELNVSEERYVRVLGQDFTQAQPTQVPVPGVPGQASPFEKISPEDLASRSGIELDVTIDVATKDPDTQIVKRRRTMEAFSALAQAAQFDPALVPLTREMGIQMAESYDIHNARAQVAAGEQALMQQQQQQALAAAAGQGNLSGFQNTGTEGSQLAADTTNAQGLPS